MRPFPLLIVLAAVMSSSHAMAQLAVGQNDIGTHGMIYKYNDPSKIGSTKAVKPGDVHGNYFYSKDWHRALVVMKPGNNYVLKAAKVNYFTNQIHYPGTDTDTEMAVGINNVRRLLLYSNDPADSTSIVAMFDILPNFETKSDFFYQVLNDGDIQLLKGTTVATNKMAVDPMTNRESYYVYTKQTYFIRRDKALKPLKSLSKSSVFEIVPDTFTGKEWLTAHKNKLKKEEDVIAFLMFLNTEGK
jgi:hypothetical protein